MRRPDTTFDLTVRKVLVRDQATDDETTAWNVASDQMSRPCWGESLADALRVMADCLEADPDERVALSVEQLAGENGGEHR